MRGVFVSDFSCVPPEDESIFMEVIRCVRSSEVIWLLLNLATFSSCLAMRTRWPLVIIQEGDSGSHLRRGGHVEKVKT